MASTLGVIPNLQLHPGDSLGSNTGLSTTKSIDLAVSVIIPYRRGSCKHSRRPEKIVANRVLSPVM